MNTVRRCQPLLGTFVEITTSARMGGNALQEITGRAFQQLAEVARMMSFHDPASELSRLNRDGAESTQDVHPWLWERIRRAVELSRASDGAFDITVAGKLVKWGLLPRHQPPRKTGGRWHDIVVLEGHRIGFRRPLTVDLGGIAKGFAVDQAVLLLRDAGVSRASVNAGGDLRILGDAPETIEVRNPAAPYQATMRLPMPDCSAATSAACFSVRRKHFRKVSHLVDPANGMPYCGKGSVTVFSPDCEWADALTKVVLFSKNSRTRDQVLRKYRSSCVVILPGQLPLTLPA